MQTKIMLLIGIRFQNPFLVPIWVGCSPRAYPCESRSNFWDPDVWDRASGAWGDMPWWNYVCLFKMGAKGIEIIWERYVIGRGAAQNTGQTVSTVELPAV